MWLKEPTYIITQKSLADPRVLKLFAKKVLNGKLVIIPDTQAQTNNELTHERRLRHLQSLQQLLKGKLKVIDKPLDHKDLLKLLKGKHRYFITTMAQELLPIKDELTGLNILDLNELYKDLEPDYLPGTELRVVVSKRGKEETEGIGYVDGGIKVVISDGARYLGKELEVIVTAGIETNVGKLIFARPKYREV
ncbi:MAG: TRAM domain-containing protein [candidate division WOR-3 bacterium]